MTTTIGSGHGAEPDESDSEPTGLPGGPDSPDPFGPNPATRPAADLLPRSGSIHLPSPDSGWWWQVVLAVAMILIGYALFAGLRRAPVCIGCDTPQRVGVSKAADGETLAIRFVSCGFQDVRRFAIISPATGQVFWEAVADPPQPADSLVVGQVTSAFTETKPLLGALPIGELVAVVESDSVQTAPFRVASVRPTKIYWDGVNWSPEGFETAVRDAGGCAEWVGPLGASAGNALLWGIVIAALGLAGLSASRMDYDFA